LNRSYQNFVGWFLEKKRKKGASVNFDAMQFEGHIPIKEREAKGHRVAARRENSARDFDFIVFVIDRLRKRRTTHVAA
jgi:hypothetical protein